MLIEYMNKTYPTGSWRTNVKLGRPSSELEAIALTPAEKRMLRITMFSADAVALLPNRVDIIECLVRPEWEKICKLKMYGHLFGVTEEYREHWHKPRRLIIVCAVTNEFVEWFSRSEGVHWIQYRPIWFDEYAAATPAYRVTPPSMKPPSKLNFKLSITRSIPVWRGFIAETYIKKPLGHQVG